MHFNNRSAFFFDMICKDVIYHLESWAPKEIAWEHDNVGLQVGSENRRLKNILLSLDLTSKAIDEAISRNCNLIITHHPFIFYPLHKIDTGNDQKSKMIEQLVKNNITLYSAHTNLDMAKDGVSFQLANKLKLQNLSFLRNLAGNQVKLVVFVPASHINKVAEAIHNKGGGIIGEYSHCSFRTAGTGSFMGSNSSNPAIGKKGKLEKVEEVKMEVLVDSFKLNNIISAMKHSHPYEEVAFDLYPLKNENVNYGMGVVGELLIPMTVNNFLKYVSTSLKIKNIRYTNGTKQQIKKVAVCGGSGSELIPDALKIQADAYITADVKYHGFQDAEEKLLLIDAGHYETEIFCIDEIQRRLRKFLANNSKTKVFKFRGSTNPVIFFNN
jgi:dinuclear metal center YbgI/SA1388 family protein